MAQYGRPPQQSPADAAQSFKTNVNRNKTKKWTEAKSNNYDGGDWDGFDPYDEYGNYDEPSPAAPGFPGGPSPGGTPGVPRPGMPGSRQHSFESGEERRAFSTGNRPPPGQYQRGYPPPQPPYATQSRGSSQDGRGSGDYNRRDFSQPTHIPPPLHMRPSHSPTSAHSPHERVPMRPTPPQQKISDGQREQLPLVEHGASSGGDKPAPSIPFIRPSDIYKRMEEARERERQSMDSARPSVDSGSSRQTGAGHADSVNGTAAPATVRYDVVQPSKESAAVPQSRFQDAASTTTVGAPKLTTRDSTQVTVAGFQSLVDQAFERTGADSPALTTSGSAARGDQVDLTRSNTESTSNISPIMSNVPSASLAAARGRAEARHTEASSIPKRPSAPDATAPATLQASDTFEPTGHQRQASGPSPHASPARPPVVEAADLTQKQPQVAELSRDDTITALPSLSTNLASPTAGRTDHSRPGSSSGTPIASPTTGRESPFPGRVKDLAGRYNEIDDVSRRDSQASTNSKYSTSTWATKTTTGDPLSRTVSRDGMAAESPIEDMHLPPPPALQSHASFRPQLPGGWDSTNTIPQSSTIGGGDPAPTPRPEHTNSAATPHFNARGPSDHVDFSPTAKDSSHEEKGIASTAIDALKAAGSALGASLLSSPDDVKHETRDFAAADDAASSKSEEPNQKRSSRLVGDVYLRPVSLERTASSVPSSAAPTPPAKDSAGAGRTYFEDTALTTGKDQLNHNVGDDRLESDRLRDEIVRSLTPQAEREPDAHSESGSVHPAPANEPKQAFPLRVSQSVQDGPAAPTYGSTLSAGGGPGLLSQRFSFENRSLDLLGPVGLVKEDAEPRTALRLSTPGSTSHETEQHDPSRARQSVASSLTPGTASREAGTDISPVTANGERPSLDTRDPPSPIRGHDGEALQHTPTQDVPVLSGPREEADLPAFPEEPPVPTTNTHSADSAKIAPFRQMMTIKSPSERIETYNSARRQFAEMDTGLSNWLTTTLAARPEHDPASLRSAATSNTGLSGHLSANATQGRQASGSYPSNSPQAALNVEKVSAKGKDLLHSAGKLGGKGVVGAKGWLAKGKQKLRESSGAGDKVDGSDRSRPHTPSDALEDSSSVARSASPAFTDERPLSASNRRSRMSGRTSVSWSSKRLSFTMDKIRNSFLDEPRSRPQSAYLPEPLAQRQPPTERGMKGGIEGLQPSTPQLRGPETKHRHAEPSQAQVSDWRPDWNGALLDTSSRPQYGGADFRLGVLPSPGVETFTHSIRDPDGNTLQGTPLKQRSSIAEFDRIWGATQPDRSAVANADAPMQTLEEARSPSPSERHVSMSNGLQHTVDSAAPPGPERSSVDTDDLEEAEETRRRAPPKSPVWYVDDDEPIKFGRKDTPMMSAPAVFVNDERPNQVADPDMEWHGLRPGMLNDSEPPSRRQSYRLSSMTHTTGGHFRSTSDATLGSEGVFEEPAAVEMIRVTSPRPVLITSRSSHALSQMRTSKPSTPNATLPNSPLATKPNSPTATPRRGQSPVRANRRLNDAGSADESTPRPSMHLPGEYPESTGSPPRSPLRGARSFVQANEGTPTIDKLLHAKHIEHMSDMPVHMGATAPVAHETAAASADSTGEQTQAQDHPDRWGVDGANVTHPVVLSNDLSDSREAERQQIRHRFADAFTTLGPRAEDRLDQTASQEERSSSRMSVSPSQPTYSVFPRTRQVSDSPGGYEAHSEQNIPRDRQVQQARREDLYQMHSRQPSLVVASMPPSTQLDIYPEPNARQHTRRASTGIAKTFAADQSGRSDPAMDRPMTSTMDLDRTNTINRLVKKDRKNSAPPPTSNKINALQVDDKEKRLSGFRGLFGRSKSNAVQVPKRNRLSKQAPVIGAGPKRPVPRKEGSYQHAPRPSEEITLFNDSTLAREMTPLSRRGSNAAHYSPRHGSISSATGYGAQRQGSMSSRNGYATQRQGSIGSNTAYGPHRQNSANNAYDGRPSPHNQSPLYDHDAEPTLPNLQPTGLPRSQRLRPGEGQSRDNSYGSGQSQHAHYDAYGTQGRPSPGVYDQRSGTPGYSNPSSHAQSPDREPHGGYHNPRELQQYHEEYEDYSSQYRHDAQPQQQYPPRKWSRRSQQPPGLSHQQRQPYHGPAARGPQYPHDPHVTQDERNGYAEPATQHSQASEQAAATVPQSQTTQSLSRSKSVSLTDYVAARRAEQGQAGLPHVIHPEMPNTNHGAGVFIQRPLESPESAVQHADDEPRLLDRGPEQHESSQEYPPLSRSNASESLVVRQPSQRLLTPRSRPLITSGYDDGYQPRSFSGQDNAVVPLPGTNQHQNDDGKSQRPRSPRPIDRLYAPEQILYPNPTSPGVDLNPGDSPSFHGSSIVAHGQEYTHLPPGPAAQQAFQQSARPSPPLQQRPSQTRSPLDAVRAVSHGRTFSESSKVALPPINASKPRKASLPSAQARKPSYSTSSRPRSSGKALSTVFSTASSGGDTMGGLSQRSQQQDQLGIKPLRSVGRSPSGGIGGVLCFRGNGVKVADGEENEVMALRKQLYEGGLPGDDGGKGRYGVPHR